MLRLLCHIAIELVFSVVVSMVLGELFDAFDEVSIGDPFYSIIVPFWIEYETSLAAQTSHSVFAALMIIITLRASHNLRGWFYSPSDGSHAWDQSRYRGDKR